MFRLSSVIIALMLSFNAVAQSPHGSKLNIKCDVCHDPNNWAMKVEGSTFDHNQTSYPLTGQHLTVDCKLCHVDLIFSNAKPTCTSCHMDMHQQTVGNDCERCHTPRSWIVKNIFEMHQLTRFPLNGIHAQTDCYQCHKSASLLRFDPMGTACSDCHLKDYTMANQPSHILSKFPKDCFLCHTEKTWQPAKFNHNVNTSFPLNGGHQGIDCVLCHSKGYTISLTSCVSCHLTDFNTSRDPAHIAAKFSNDCKACHTEVSWKPASYNHNTATSFPLTGSHAGVDCISCHTKGYSGISSDCVSCHLLNYNSTTSPSHVAAKYSTDCKICHSVTAWKPATFDHNTATSFPLTGAHFGVDCINCHANGYTSTSTACVSCHLTNYNGSTNPGHIAAKFSTDCKTCHNVTAWSPSTFNHNVSTSFQLAGSHLGLTCLKCHTMGYAGISSDCVSCHLANYNATTNPSHASAKYSTECKSCHNVTAWKPATFDHNSTLFPLTGAHIGVDCILCHSKGYAGTSTVCVSCHQTNYSASTNPSHVNAKFSTDCKSCHSVTAWKPASFNHNTATTFPLTGGHVGLDCITSHATTYAGTQTTCVSCHLAKYNATTNPGHVLAKISTDCATCHTSTAWSPATFNHTTGTTFPLTGAHITVSCVGCHLKGYAGISTTCVSCHLANYNASTNPAHAAAKFPTTCENCHTSVAWAPSTFNHATATTFPLTGGHVGVACVSCHTTGYAGISTTCVSCHLTNYNATTNPGHVAAKFSTDCATCHTVTAWLPGTFNHTTGTTFPLTGAHTALSCISCHATGYVGIATTCVSCHLAKYNATTNPAHSAAKFPTDCETCHTATVWTTSTYNHDSQFFRINSGKHNGQWTLCSDCHTSATNYAIFNCLQCHTHNQATTDSEHKGKTGYVYNSTNCLSCHPKV